MCPKPTYLTIYEDDLENLKEIGDYFVKTHEHYKDFPEDKPNIYGQFALALMYAKLYMEEKSNGI